MNVTFCPLVCILATSLFCIAAPAPPDAFDPNPLPDDLVLPMPKEARMVFRPVFLGIDADLRTEREYQMGDRTGRYAREKVVPVSVGGSFVGENNGKKDRLFYIGKYEVTQSQFRAIMGEKTEGGELPMTRVERLEVDQFILAYNRFLLSPQGKGLPSGQGSQAFLRLPNEEEWEFAARGGCLSSESKFEQRSPYNGMLARYEWSESTSFGKLKKIGLLSPNPLNLFDMLGNAAEMTSTPYQREHGVGGVGGYVVRGGSFRNTEAELRASLRSEQLMMDGEGNPTKDETIGFRLVIASQAVPNPFPAPSPLYAGGTQIPPATTSPARPIDETPRVPLPATPRPPPETPIPAKPIAGTTVPISPVVRLATPAPRRIGPQAATKEQPFRNSLQMSFVPVRGTKVLFAVCQTRRSEYFAFAGRTFDDPEVFPGLRLGGDETHPMINVSQAKAIEFCHWLEAKDLDRLGIHVKYRLPTPVEWIAACGNHRFPWGDLFPPHEVVGNYGDRSLSKKIQTPFSPIPGYVDGYVTTSPAGRFPPNEFGLFDLGSNVQEWGAEPDSNGWVRVMGASWRSFKEEDMLVNVRLSLPASGMYPFVGFRCVVELP
jgi:formylglycine-generating enzyme required for sulfatase activity